MYVGLRVGANMESSEVVLTAVICAFVLSLFIGVGILFEHDGRTKQQERTKQEIACVQSGQQWYSNGYTSTCKKIGA